MAQTRLQTPIQYVKGVGPKLAQVLARIGVRTVEDLLYLVPREYEDRRNAPPLVRIRPCDLAVVKGEIIKIDAQRTRNRFNILKVYLSDRTATIQAVWFNQPYLEKMFRPGMKLIVTGKVEVSSYDGILQLLARDYEIDTGDNLLVVPRYPLTEGLYPKKLRSVIKTALENYLQYVEEAKTRKALLTLHQPADPQAVLPARNYLAYEELLAFQLGLLLRRKQQKEELKGKVLKIDEQAVAEFKAALPFKFTAAQEKVVAEITADLRSGRPMNRLLQGDVGSGKTAVAALAAFLTIRNGQQAALLAPTEILAQQHFGKLAELFKKLKCRAEILTHTTASDKKREELKDKDIIIGTHALLEEKVKFRDLGLVAIDEQHRFGVHQRARLRQKRRAPRMCWS